MRTLFYTLFIALNFIFHNNALTQVTVVKNYNYKYKSIIDSKLTINNSYGNVNIVNCNSDSILVEVKIKSTAKNEEKAVKRLGLINISEINENNSFSISTLLLKDNIPNNDNERVNVEYTVKIPIYLNLSIANMYGNINIEEHHGKLNINLIYGNFYAKNLIFGDSSPLSKLKFTYSDANITYCNWAEITSEYTNLNIKKAKTLILSTNYTKIKIDTINLVKINSNYDIYKIEYLSKIVSKSNYSKITLNYLDTDIKTESNYGNLTVNYISNLFENIDVKHNNGNVKLIIDENASYKSNCSVSYGKILKPKKANINIYENNSTETIKGIIGADKNTKKTVSVVCNYCNLEF